MNLAEINREIYALETGPTTCSACEKLASLYVVRDHLDLQPMQERVEDKSKAFHYEGGEFVEACNGVPMDVIMRVMEEHMEAVKALYPKEYDAVIKKLKEGA